MERRSAPAWPSPEFIASALTVDDAGRLVWKDRPKDNNRHVGRLAGSLRDGRTVVSIRYEGRMRTYLSDRVIFVLKNGAWPKGVVDQGVDRPRRAKSPGRRGGKAAEAARDRATLSALADEPSLTVSALAARMSLDRSNVSRRLRRLMGCGLTEAVCVPGRSHWLVTAEGRERVEADLIDPPAPVAAEPWVKPLVTVPPNPIMLGMGVIARFG